MSTVGNTAKIKDFPSGPVIKSLPSNEGDTGLMSGWGTQIPDTVGQLNPCSTTIEAHIPQLEKRKSPCTSMKTQRIKTNKQTVPPFIELTAERVRQTLKKIR